MYKSKRQKNKSFDWYGLSQRFSIRKYHFGAASVLLGTALILGAAQTTAKAEETATENKTEAVASAPKDGEGATSPTNVTLPATEARTGAPVLDKKELSEEEIAKLVAEASKKDDKTSETATTEKSEVTDKEKATQAADSTDKKSEKAVDDKADKKDEKKAENPIAATKTILEQLTSEAEVLNTTAANYAEKKVEDKSSKEAIAAAVAAAKVEIAASKKVLNQKDVTAEQLNLQLQRISSAIEAVYTEMKRAGHIGKVEAVLADVTATVKLPERTKVRNTSSLTDEEVDGIIRQVRIANPNLTDADKISVLKNSGQANNAGEVTITYANGDTAKIASGDAVIGAGVARNLEGLKDAINWFEFSAASIVYPDGTEVGPARYLDTPKQIQVDHPNGSGSKVTANLNIVRDVKYADGTTGLTTDDKFLKSGITEFTVHEYYTGGFQNNNEAYEVLKEGMVLKVPTRVKGYNLTLRVEKLGPKQVATDPNNTETRGKNAMNAAQNADKRFKPVKMILTTQDTTNSYLYKAGMQITDKNNRPALAAVTANRDGSNAGITFSASATFNGQPVPVNLVVADGEESGRGEVLQFETNGSNWKELMAVNLTEKQIAAQKDYKLGGEVAANTAGNLRFYGNFDGNGYNADEWVNKVQDTDAQGNPKFNSQGQPIMKEVAYGTKLFGPTWNAMRQGNALGFGFSENVSEFSIYVNSAGAQAGSIGFVVYDGGDAPQSFGTAQHVIGNINRTNEQGQQVVATQPHFGDEPGDPDFRSTATDPSGAWVLDDLINTNGYKIIGMKEENSVTNEAGETGTYKLVDINGRKTPVLLKADGSTTALKTGEILKIINPEDNFPVKGIFDAASQGVGIGTLPDEGKGQLLDPAVAVDYKLRQATDSEYVLDGIKVNPGENNEKAYARGWVDFNNNGKFDEDESSEVVEVTGKQTVSFKFKNTPQLLNTSIDSVGVRLRIALDRKEILSPTGLASSGEVEDFQTHVIHPPRGTENKTQDLQGKPQNLTLNTTDLFTATGKTEASKYSTWNEIDNTIAPKFVLTESAVASETETGTTVNITDATGTTVYNGKEVVVRDARGNVLGTAVKVTNPLNNKTEYLLSEYTEYDTAGNKVGVYRLNKDNNGLNKASSNGIYRTTIDFEPALPYVGTAKGVAIRAWDQNRISTGWNANEKTITESKKNITLADKDKILKNVNENVNGRYSMDSTYIPTVVDVRPVGEDTVTTDVQGKQQSATPKIPAYGTVETQTGDKITDVKYTSDYVILDETKKPTFAKTLENRKSSYTTDTTVNKTTTLTLEDGRIITYKTDTDKFAKDTRIAADSSVTVTGTGGVVVNNVRITSGNTIPAGAKPQSNHPAKSEVRVQLKDGSEQTIPAGGTILGGATLLEPMVTKDNNTWDNVTYNTGDTIPQSSAGKIPILGAATSASQIVSKGNVVKVGDQYYSTNIIPAGTKIKAVLPFNEITLPKAIHLDPDTGVITEVPRSYDLDSTKTNDTKVTIKGEGVYELNQDTGKVTFTPEPGFVGTGTGVDLEQPDIDYNDKVTGDKVTERYGTDFGRAKYTPIVTPSTSASITRTIHYVYENDDDNPNSTASYTDNKEILAIDGAPVVTKQTLNYTRTYKIFEEDGVLEEATRSAVPVTDVNGKTYAVGEEIPAGTKFAQGKIIISEWKTLEGNAVMKQVISPTVKGYTANVITADFTAANAQGKMEHIHNNKQPVGLYTPVPDNTRDVGEYEPLVSEVTSDKTDDFDMYVVYKRDTQKANVVYIDLDEKGDKRVLEIQSGITTADLTAANKQPEAKTTYNVADLRGKSDTKIPYDTAATIKKYTDKGFELASDDYTNDENGNALANGRNFDEDSTNDQTFYVYLRHKKEQLSKNDVRTVTRHIEYKYADTAEVPADKRGQAVETTLAKKVTEVLTFERTRTIDMVATAKLYETQYNAFKAVAANNAVGSDAEVEARATLFKYVEDKAKEAGATDEAKAVISYGEWQAKPGQATNLTLSAAEENIKDSKFNDVVSPTVPGYLPDNAKVEATADINPESDPKEYTVTVTYSPGDQKAIVNFVEVDATNTDQVITPGLTTPVTLTGKSGTAFPTTASTSVQAKIDELVKKGYELVPNGNGFVATDSFDTNSEVDQTYTVKLRVKPITVTPNDPTPTPNTPIDPNNPTGPKWTPELIKELEDGRKEEVKRTINYVYADGTKAKDSVEETKEFKRSATINPVTGKITFGEWSAAQTFEEKQSPAIDNYTPNKASVEAKEVTATADDITETVIYSTSKVTVDPNPVDPNENPDPNKVVENDPKKRTLKELGLVEEVKHTIHYVYEDGTKADEDVVQTLTYTRTAKIDPVTGAISDYSTWTAKKGDDFTAVTSPAKEGYIVSKATSTAINDVPATADDTEETIIYRKLGSYIPVVPEGVTVPPGTDTTAKVYPKNPNDPTKPGTPTTTIPEIPGTTPVGPDGTPLTKNPNGGYNVPPVPTDPTQNTTITYVKDGSQVAVVHFVDEKGNSVNESVVETGDTGKEISTTKADAVKKALEAKGYEVVAPTDALYTADKEGFYKEADRKFDAVSDKATGAADEKVPSQQYYVIVKGKELPVDPTKPLDPNNNPVDPTNPTPENPTTPRDPETPVTPKPEDKVPNDPKGRTYGELGLVEQVTRTINYVKNDGSKAAEPVKETLTFTRKAKINAVTGEVTYLDNDGNATTKEAAPWTPANNDSTFDKVTSPSVPDYTPTRAEVPAKENVTATDEDIVETVVYNPTKQTVDPNAPKDPSTPDVTPKPNDVVPNDPKGRTYKELGLIEEVTRTVHYVYEDGTKAAEDKVQTITFTRTAEIDTVTGAISNFGTWTLKDENNTFEPETTEAKDGYIASAAKSTEVTGVQATDKDTEETIIYRKLGSYVPVVPAGVTPPADFDKTPKPYPNATPEDPTRPGTPTTPTTTIPEIPGTTPVGPDGTPLTKNPNGGYDLPPVPTDPTQNTTITYVKDGSQVAVVHFVDEKGNSVNESVVETGDTGKEISKSNVDAVKAKLEAKGYEVVAPTDALYTTDKEGFYKEATRTFDAVSDKSTGAAGEKVPSQQYYVIVKAKDLPVDPTKPLDPNNNPVDPTNPTPENPTKPRDPETPVTPKPEDKVPNDPKGRTYGELGLVEQVTRTINYVKNDGSKAAEPVKETLTFTRKAKINAVTGEVTYLDNDGNATTKEAAPWTPVNNDTTFDKVTSPSVPDYTPTKAEVPAKENVTATDEDIVETVVYNPTKVTVTPNDPNVDPEKPLNPNDPNGLKYKDLKLTEEVKRTITYTYADDVADTSKRGTDAALKHETTVSFTRTATVNQATGEVTYGDWTAVNNDTTLEGKTELPVITGYVATGDVESSKKDVANVTATDKDIVEKVVYKDLGKYVPVVPEGTTPPTITDPKYPNNPTDPTKPGEPTTTIPNVPGLTPLDPSTGKPLEPKDPNDLTKGYKPPVPQDPSKDTNIVYVKDGSQVTVVHFVDEDGNAVHTSFVEAGDAGAKFTKAGEVTKVVEELKAAGYTVVPNKAGQAEYPGEAGVFDSVDDKGKDGVSQVYYVTVAKTVPVTPTNPENPNEDPKNPKPGDPIDPNKPDGPKWTEDALNKLNNIKSVTRTITYVKAGTDEEVSPTTAPKVTDKVSFTRTAIVNPKDGSLVGYDTNGDGKADVPATDTDSGWKAVNDDTTFDKVTSPVVPGYVLKNAAQKEVAATTGLTPKSDNENIKVEYVPVGTWTPKVPDGETPIDPIPYPNDPTDPGKVVDPNDPTTPNDPNKPSVPVIPHIPGTTPKDPNGNPLKPVDPADPSKGYVPPTPKTPTENTVIEYVKDTQKATVKYVVAGTNTVLHTDELEGKSGEPINYSTATKLAELKELGYDLVTDGFTTATDKNYDKDTKVDQSFVVTVTPHVEPIKPFDPTNPNDPNTPKPGQPIDPNNPDGPKWTEELINKLETTKHVTRKITYVEDGTDKEVADKATDKVTFTREAKINVVTGTIEYGKWTPVNNDTTFDKVTSPVVPGYVLKDPAQKEVAETTGLTENSKDETIKVVYVPVGRLVPKVPEGVTPPTPTPYDNDPQDPGKVVPPSPTKPTDPQDPNSPKVPVIPHIPGTTPKVPQDPTKPVDPNTNPLVPLKPVDPKDPSKGYEVPPVPTDPGTDTPIVYENDKQKVITNFVDNNGKVVSDPVVDYGESGSKFTKSGDVESKIKELVKKGYVVTSNDYPSADTDRVFDNDKDKDQIFNVKVTPLIVPTDPNSPDQPQVPTDPTKPVGPNNPLKPVTPSTPEPGKPVFPEDPNSPVWPETVKDMVTETTATRTITYVDRNGKEVAATHTETIKFKRTAKVNLVTGDITYGEWIVVGNDTILDGNKLPKVDGYIARGGDIESSQKDIKATAGVNITERVVYDKLGSWIPKLPEGQTQVPPTPYPNDPTDPTKPGTDRPRVPYVPGFIPVDPNGNPLKPVDPNDPTKGYEVPVVPADPTQDTPIKYIPVPKPNNGGGNNGGGGGNTPTPQPQPNPTPQPEPSPAPNPVPVTPETPEQPVVPVAPEQPAEPATPQYMDGQRELPNTGTEAHSSLAALGLLGALSGFGLIARKKREDEE
ncbi:mucin-binding protein [Streptococcus mitis]|uniref:mucin-binding protein n=1 Tax=Streptococcus mitis TaxID=28037 RepID=UPI002000C2B8|nr:GEVED domain-containing protein [Streptococcus mitis]